MTPRDPAPLGDDAAAGGAPLWIAFLALCEQAARDGLTGLRNRRYFDETLADHLEAASRYGRPLALVLFDLDRFKRINDTLGHEAGDAVLRKFGRILGSAARKADIACRIGGDEFAVILPETDLAGARQFAERIGQTLHESGLEVSVTAGVAAQPPCPNLHAAADADLLAGKGEAISRPER